MSARSLAALTVLGCVFLSPCLADTIVFKDGSTKTVRIYKTASGYLSYLYQGKIEVVSRAKVKSIKVEGKPLTEKELAAALKKSREAMKRQLKEEEAKNGVKVIATPKVKSVTDGKTPIKGVQVIDKAKSKTKATELKIDPFPDHPTKKDKGTRGGAAKRIRKPVTPVDKK